MGYTKEQRAANLAKARKARTEKQEIREEAKASVAIDAPEQSGNDWDNLSDEELLVEMESLQSAPEPGSITTSPTLLHRHKESDEDDETPVTMVSRVQSAGYVVMYDQRDGALSRFNRNMVPYKLRERDPVTGKRVWSKLPPKGITPAQGTIKCLLHPDRRDEELPKGLKPCFKHNIPNEWELELHMTHKHAKAYAAIKELERQREREEDRQFRKAMISTMQKGA